MQSYLESFGQLLKIVIDFVNEAPTLIILAIQVLIVLIVGYFLNKFTVRYIRRAGKRLDFPPELTNGLVMVARIIIILAVLIALSSVGGLPPDFLVSISAIAGAAVGFAATRTIGNFIAGIYLLISRPFRIGDYIRIGDKEGIVKEMTVNYTKLQMPDGTSVLMSNQTILDATVINFSSADRSHYIYPLEAGFDYSLTSNEIKQILSETGSEFESNGRVKKSSFALINLNRLEQRYLINLTFEKAEDIFNVPSEFLARVAERADEMRNKKE